MKVFIGPYSFDKTQAREITVEIDNYDLWDMHDSLAFIIFPMLQKIKETKCFFPNIDLKDLPLEIQNRNPQEQWIWIVDEIAWAAEQRTLKDYGEDQFWNGEDYDYDKLSSHRARIKNAFVLFGKYYLTLGD